MHNCTMVIELINAYLLHNDQTEFVTSKLIDQ